VSAATGLEPATSCVTGQVLVFSADDTDLRKAHITVTTFRFYLRRQVKSAGSRDGPSKLFGVHPTVLGPKDAEMRCHCAS
jgi:hypothetical protein